jgi:signal transduction histidine kinase
MAWTTSDNLRDFFGSRDFPVSKNARMPQHTDRLTGSRVRQFAIIGIATVHLALLGDLTMTPAFVDPQSAAASSAFGPRFSMSLPWLTITGLMLTLLWLTRDWPRTMRQDQVVPKPPATFTQSAQTISSQNKSDPMTGLLARVSHDLRTPLNAVMGFSDMMQQEAFGPLGDARYQSYARHIHTSSVKLLKAAEDTLAMTSLVASQDKGACEAVALHELISDAFTMALLGASKPLARDQAALQSPVMLALSVPPKLQIQCERRALRQALINLLSAAISKVEVSTGDVRTISAVATTSNDVICLTISVTTCLEKSQIGMAPVDPVASSWNSAEDLPICLARALLELQGLSLTVNTASEMWRAQVVLDGVSQKDFFAK